MILISTMGFKLAKFNPEKTIFLIDGSSFLYRAYYGLRPLHTSKGVPVQAVYSFCRMIRRLVDKFGMQYVALVWDSPGKTTRHQIFPEYKATRQAAPSDLFTQKDKILQFADLVQITQVSKSGVEADDLMFSLAKDRSAAGDIVVFVTSDKDMGQALSDSVFMYDAFKDLIVDTATFAEKNEFPVEKLPFYFALLGDTSDNIPGVHGIGKKGAQELVQQFDSLEDLYANLDKIKKPRTRSALEENKANAFLSRDLFLLHYEPTKLAKEDFLFNHSDWREALPLFQELEFKSLIDEIDGKARELTVADKIEQLKKYNFKAVATQQDLDELVAVLTAADSFAMDTETDGVKVFDCNLVGLSFCVQEGTAYYVPCGHRTPEQTLSCDTVIGALRPILEDAQKKKYLHNTKFDQLILFSTHGIEMKNIVMDTMIVASLITKDWQRIGLKRLSEYYLNESMLTFQEVVKDNKYKDFSEVPLELATYYAANDAHQTFRLVPIFEKELEKEHMKTLYATIEDPLIQVLYAMEKEGIYLDTAQLAKLGEQVDLELNQIDAQICAILNKGRGQINFNSPKQTRELLFETLGLPPAKKSAKGEYSTDNEVLVELAKLHPIPGLIITYRELFKLKTTYIDALPEYVSKKTGRIHTSYNQGLVATGRLSSSDPNLQNVPADPSGHGIEVRAAFKPEPGHIFISADYSQIELRVLAHLSRDTHLVNAFLQKHDIHRETSARLFDVPLDRVTHEQRQLGKRINFSILYGLTPYGLSKDLDIPFKDAKTYIDKYFAQYPGVSRWMEMVVQETKKNGYVTTLYGRRRYIPAIYEQNRVLYDEAKRVAINTVAQGTAAEIMKIGMINLHQSLAKQGLGAKIILQIHDELLLSAPRENADQVELLVKKELESVVNWHVPLMVTTRQGADWKDVTK